jgi:phosphatidylglycerol:prolipoprotein diacylglycerol transferase
MIPYLALDQITLGPLKLYTWGLFVGLGFCAGYLLLLCLAKQKNIAMEKIAGLALAIFFGGVIGAKALPVALLSGGFFNNLDLLFSQHSGAMFMGGLIGAIVFGYLYVLSVRLDFWEIADLLILPTALGIAIGRIGCILINDHQGAVTTLPWGILWPDGILRHPVGIYESLAGLVLFGVFWWTWKNLFYSSSESCRPGRVEKLSHSSRLRPAVAWLRSNNKPGQLFLLFLASYSAIRFFLDFTRVSSGPLADPRWGVFSISQWVALLLLLFVALLLIVRKRRN